MEGVGASRKAWEGLWACLEFLMSKRSKKGLEDIKSKAMRGREKYNRRHGERCTGDEKIKRFKRLKLNISMRQSLEEKNSLTP